MKFKLICFGAVILLLPLIVWAESTPETGDSSGITKNAWLDLVRKSVPVSVCKSFVGDDSIGAQMKALNMDYSKCASLIPAVTETCIEKYNASIPTMITDEAADKWGRLLGECIGNDFSMGYLHEKTTVKPAQ